ncbi:hypothetical protein GCM10028777_09670 [Angustibacter speluncae]
MRHPREHDEYGGGASEGERGRGGRGGRRGRGGPEGFGAGFGAGFGRGFGPGPGYRGGRGRERDVPPVSESDLVGWFAGRLPDDWFTGRPEIRVDRDEILVVGTLPADGTTVEGDESATTAARLGRIARFREDTREQRVAIAQEAEPRYARKVAWGAQIDGTREVFTSLAVPVMTRLRQPEREVLDTLIDSGVARSRSEALAWCVALVAEHADDWLGQLREALGTVQRLREGGPVPPAGPAGDDATGS